MQTDAYAFNYKKGKRTGKGSRRKQANIAMVALDRGILHALLFSFF